LNLDGKVLEVVPRLIRAASASPSKYLVAAAVAYTRKGNILGITRNTHRGCDSLKQRKGASLHAEMRLMSKHGRAIDTIYILRVGASKDRCACDVCAKTAKKLNIRIVSLDDIVA
jgi:hypothetical protein